MANAFGFFTYSSVLVGDSGYGFSFSKGLPRRFLCSGISSTSVGSADKHGSSSPFYLDTKGAEEQRNVGTEECIWLPVSQAYQEFMTSCYAHTDKECWRNALPEVISYLAIRWKVKNKQSQ
ncbi:hypothetical protein EUTSA_v10023762mg [Eutrema salsugineum]|uniref:Uncharacterized protein n=1 Tax=Eutrema salsugineum TaxID=72664 RepID=V4KDC7_EUTSA|nr:hypothetical protein EUTSA_v10023762mg [Eutrema salsugineum]